MMPDQPTIVLPLDLPDVQVVRPEITTDHELLIEVESTLTTTNCRRCGQTISGFYGYDRPSRLRHLPSFGYVVYIQLRPKRFRCPVRGGHPTTTQRLSWYDPKALPTTFPSPNRLSRLLIASCLAYMWLVYLGVCALDEDWMRRIHRTDRCDLSLFQLGKRLLARCLSDCIPIPDGFLVPATLPVSPIRTFHKHAA